MHILFDLDGTLTDSSRGITRCINHALSELGYPAATDDRLRGMIGSPLSQIFADVLDCDDVVVLDRAVGAYRTRFNAVGMFENTLYPGIAEALTDLHRSGHTLQIVTAKPAVAACRIVEHFGIATLFRAVHGPDLSARDCDKALLIRAALDAAGAPAHATVMVGDRAVDMLAARQEQVRGVGATWGYGPRDELTAAGAAFLADTVDDLVRWITAETPAA